jgi:hypothetical protein
LNYFKKRSNIPESLSRPIMKPFAASPLLLKSGSSSSLIPSEARELGFSFNARELPHFVIVLLTLSFLVACGGGSSSSPSVTPPPPPTPEIAETRLSTDTFTNPESQHATEVEPGAFAFGSTIVTAFQVGRIFGGGASDIGFATSTNSGASWSSGLLPGTTVFQGGTFSAISDPAVAFDAAHNAWMI